jgi:hypothetical protein
MASASDAGMQVATIGRQNKEVSRKPALEEAVVVAAAAAALRTLASINQSMHHNGAAVGPIPRRVDIAYTTQQFTT